MKWANEGNEKKSRRLTLSQTIQSCSGSVNLEKKIIGEKERIDKQREWRAGEG